VGGAQRNEKRFMKDLMDDTEGWGGGVGGWTWIWALIFVLVVLLLVVVVNRRSRK
jgi:ABC-type multidrug transport system permease subunit